MSFRHIEMKYLQIVTYSMGFFADKRTDGIKFDANKDIYLLFTCLLIWCDCSQSSLKIDIIHNLHSEVQPNQYECMTTIFFFFFEERKNHYNNPSNGTRRRCSMVPFTLLTRAYICINVFIWENDVERSQQNLCIVCVCVCALGKIILYDIVSVSSASTLEHTKHIHTYMLSLSQILSFVCLFSFCIY